jgi:AcrR family transcriptional regulator
MTESEADHTSGPPSRVAERAAETREALISAARGLFGDRGFTAVGTEEIVRTARLTRGALYHHFASKEDLFRAVYEAVERDLVEQIAATALKASDPVAVLRAGAEAFLDACEDPEVRRIALIDAPSVLGWEQWREIGLQYGLGLVQSTLDVAMEAGMIERQPVRPLAHLLLGSIDEAGMLVARADDGGRTKREVTATVNRFLDALLGAGEHPTSLS